MRRFKGNLLSVGKPLTFETSSSKIHILKLSTQGVAAVIPISEPFTPSDVNASEPGNRQSRVSWTAPEKNGGSDITSYIVTCSLEFTQAVSGSLTTTIFSGLTNGTSYTFTVKAINIAGASSPSSPSNSVTPFTVPLAPTIGIASPSNGEVSLDWTAPSSNGGSTIIMYTVTSNNNIIKDVSGTLTTTIVSGLTNGTSYTFTVQAINIAGASIPSSPSNSVTPFTVPLAPTIGIASPGVGQVSLDWTAPSSNGGSTIIMYTVTSNNNIIKDVSGTLTTTIVSGLTNGTSYTFTVQAINIAGASIPSGASNLVTPFTVPSAPTIVTASPGNGQVSLAWTAPSSNGGSTIIMYTVTSNNNIIKDVSGTLTSTIVSGLTNGTSYTFTVQAINIAGASSPSSPSNSVTLFSVPSAPTIGTATPGNGQVSLAWTAPSSNGGSTIIMYTVTSNNNIIKDVSGTLTSTIVSGLTNGTSYTFTVKAINIAGASSQSSPSNSVTPIQPLAVVSLATANLDTTFPNNRVGSSLEISSDGNVICVTNCNSTSDRYIKIYRFNASNGTWNNEKTITTSFAETGDPFEEPAAQFWGSTLAISGNGNYVGLANSANSTFANFAGLIEVYEYNVTTQLWSRNSWLDSILSQNYIGTGSAPTITNQQWGASISFNYNGNVFAVGTGGNNGFIKIYKQNNNIWTLVNNIYTADGDGLGRNVSLSSDGTILVCGINNSNIKTFVESPTNTWSFVPPPSPETISFIAGTFQPLIRISKNRTTFIASIARQTGPIGTQQGIVKVYRFISNSWTQIGQELRGPSASSSFGSSIAISNTGNIIVIGSSGANSFFGNVYGYKYNSLTNYWDLIFSIPGQFSSDSLGAFRTFGMTSDATKLILGTPTTGNGLVRIYNVVYDNSIIP
jgi:hypothetical protein